MKFAKTSSNIQIVLVDNKEVGTIVKLGKDWVVDCFKTGNRYYGNTKKSVASKLVIS